MDNLENLMTLKNDMKKKDWTICDFIFEFNGVEYIVLVNRFVGNTIRENKYAVVKLNFMKCENLKDELPVEASIKQLFIDAKTLREYFGIKYSENLGNILNQFTYRLGQSVPKTMPDMKTLTDFEKGAIVRSLSISDSEDPNKSIVLALGEIRKVSLGLNLIRIKQRFFEKLYTTNLLMTIVLVSVIQLTKLKRNEMKLFISFLLMNNLNMFVKMKHKSTFYNVS